MMRNVLESMARQRAVFSDENACFAPVELTQSKSFALTAGLMAMVLAGCSAAQSPFSKAADHAESSRVELASNAVTTTTVDDSAAGWTYGGGWFAYADPDAYEQTAHGAQATGGYGQYTFTGTGVSVYTWKGPGGGNLEVLIDGVAKGTFSQSGSTDIYNQLLFAVSGLTSGSHTVKLLATNSGWTMVDYIVISSSGGGTPTPTPTPSATPTPSPTPIAGGTGSLGLPNPTSTSVSQAGPYSYQTYKTGIVVPNGSIFTDPGVYYPVNGPALSPGMIYIPGNDGQWDEGTYYSMQNGMIESSHVTWAQFLASNGVISFLINPTDLGASPETRATALLQAVQAFIAESKRVGSPIYGKLDVNNIGLMGHSYGGAGAMIAAASNSSPNVKLALCLSPVGGDATGSKVPIMILGGTGDEYEDGDQSLNPGDDLFIGEYNSIPTTVSNGFGQIIFNPQFDSMHDVALCPLCWHSTDPTVARLGMSFVQTYLAKDSRFAPFITNSSFLSIFDYRP